MIIQVQGVKKTYRQGEVEVKALRGVDLEIEAGAFVAIAGPSGSGKSTLLNIISGLDRPSEGTVLVEGRNISEMSNADLSALRKERVGFVFQSYNLMPVLTAFENAEYVLMLQGMSADERRTKVMALLERVGLKGMEHRFPRQLSGGQQQRVAIARAIASEPALVLADEPTANVDSKTGAALLDLMEELNRDKGITFVFSSHDMAVINRARTLVLLRDGEVFYQGPPEGRPEIV